MDNMNFEQLRQMGMAPSRQIDMAPLNIPGVAQPPSAPTQGVGNIDTRISELENMFANVYTNRAFSQQEMQDMNQKRQLLDNLYRIRESSQSRALADEERKQKIEALRQMGEKAKEDKRNAQLAKAKEIPSTFVSERMGQNPYVPAGAGTFIDSQGRTAAVPKYGTVTPAMYGALGESRLKGTAAPTAQDFQPKETPYTITENRINEAIKLNDYGKASMLAQQQINNLAQIAAMPGLSEEAKQVLNANMISLANQAKNNAGIYQEQIKAKALVQKQPLKAVETEPKNAKLSLDEKKQLANIYKDVYDQKIKVPVGKNYEGNIVYQEKPLFLLSADEVQLALKGEKTGTTGKDIAKRQYEERAKLILPDTITEIPENVQNAPQGTQVNLTQEEKTTIAFEALKAIHQANIPTEKVLKDLSTEEGRKDYRQQFPGIDLNNLIAALNSSPDSNIQLQTMNKLLQSARSKGEKNASVIVNKKSSNKTSINNKKTTTIDSSMPQIDLSLIPNTFSSIRELGLQAKKISPEISSNISYLANILPQKEQYKLSPKGARTLRSMMDSVTLNQVLTPAPEEPIMTPPITNERQVMKPTIQDVAEAINEAELINRKRIANGEPPLDSRIFDLINIWKRKINQELYPTPKGYPSPEVEALSKPQRYIDLNRNY